MKPDLKIYKQLGIFAFGLLVLALIVTTVSAVTCASKPEQDDLQDADTSGCPDGGCTRMIYVGMTHCVDSEDRHDWCDMGDSEGNYCSIEGEIKKWYGTCEQACVSGGWSCRINQDLPPDESNPGPVPAVCCSDNSATACP
jgi:hypothetical protein